MKTLAFAFISVLLVSTANAAKRAPASTLATPPGELAMGLMVGNIIAATGKYWISEDGALDFGLGFTDGDNVTGYADYLWHIPGIFGNGSKFGRETSGYMGGGGGIGYWNDSYRCGRWDCDRRNTDSGTGLFVRAIFGFEWYPLRTRFGVFGEAGPTFLFAPSTSASLDVGVGGRYYF